ncbi:hypothetical protein EV122DRAFT_285384 [Schizophyllum commune]|nr:hypothetical protein K525DRAFT_275798 [Schizophyllum commune Loenen D]
MDWARAQPHDRFTFNEEILHSVNPSPTPDAADAPPLEYITAVSAYIFAFCYHTPVHRAGSRDKSKRRARPR